MTPYTVMPKTTFNVQTLGLALRAGKLIHGEEAVLEGFRKYPHYYVFMASDAGANIQKKIQQKAFHYDTPINQSFDRQTLSKALGKERTVCALIDEGFIKTIG